MICVLSAREYRYRPMAVEWSERLFLARVVREDSVEPLIFELILELGRIWTGGQWAWLGGGVERESIPGIENSLGQGPWKEWAGMHSESFACVIQSLPTTALHFRCEETVCQTLLKYILRVTCLCVISNSADGPTAYAIRMNGINLVAVQ